MPSGAGEDERREEVGGLRAAESRRGASWSTGHQKRSPARSSSRARGGAGSTMAERRVVRRPADARRRTSRATRSATAGCVAHDERRRLERAAAAAGTPSTTSAGAHSAKTTFWSRCALRSVCRRERVERRRGGGDARAAVRRRSTRGRQRGRLVANGRSRTRRAGSDDEELVRLRSPTAIGVDAGYVASGRAGVAQW